LASLIQDGRQAAIFDLVSDDYQKPNQIWLPGENVLYPGGNVLHPGGKGNVLHPGGKGKQNKK
jgi:hypothetical protein